LPDMTARKIITSAYRKGAIKTLDQQKLEDGLEDLHNLLASWSIDSLIVPYLTDETFTMTIGKADYTIGASGDFNTVRPTRIVDAYVRIDSYDYPIDTYMEENVYNNIASKSQSNRPSALFYDRQYPLGKIKFDYAPSLAYELHLFSEKPFSEPALDDSFSIPTEYNSAMIYNLAVMLASDCDNKLLPQVFVFAEQYLDAIKHKNGSTKTGITTVDNALLFRG